ncbi:ribokinase [Amycolatopsis jiangsuensis]|uniref:Ribokinase n=1 Tax=Amycolatopsis jiangsuensis TaxID=1181879 RepID=A0A840J774_9PSEU|nr:ribokinase [Amycolatopsis jiangsuensis]MBB4689227.1 ribokinase [Amycolatopsis jiangsuensis]
MSTGRIVSVGSVNLDHSLRVPAIAKPGETVLADSARAGTGGKSFNQAAAARLLGGEVELVAMTGDDDAARTVRTDLRDLGIVSDRVLVCRDEPTGSAFISVDATGENAIVVVPGANARLTATDEVSAAVVEADVVLLALEVPLDTVTTCARHAAASGAKVVLNLSPYRAVPDELLRDCFVVIVNRHELAQLCRDVPDGWAETAAALDRAGIRRAIVTLGAQGSVLFEAGEHTRVPAVRVNAVDTTGSGDAFAGAVGYGLARGLDLLAATRLASGAGALAATRPGARASYPTMAQLGDFLEELEAEERG